MFLRLLILLSLLCLGVSFLQAAGSSSHCFWCLPPVGEVGSVRCVGFLVKGTGACALVDEADLAFLVGWTESSGVFWGVCELIMILGSLFASGWGCVPVLLVVWHGVSSTGACWSLSGAGS